MKYLLFAFAIAIILEDWGTFQAESIASCTSTQRVELFKKYALNLVIAAIPPLDGNKTLTEGGCECRLPTDGHLNPVDLALETMCIAKNDHRAVLEAIRDTEDVSAIQITDELRENIRRILVVLESWPDSIDLNFMFDMMKTYLLKYKPNPSDVAAEPSDENVDSAMKCYRTLCSFEYIDNTDFFDGLFNGFGIASDIMRDDAEELDHDSLWSELSTIIEEISHRRLHTLDEENTNRAYEKLLYWLYGQTADSDLALKKLLEWDSD